MSNHTGPRLPPPCPAPDQQTTAALVRWAESYAEERVAAERERCAVLVETQDTYGDHVGCWFETLAAKIRAPAAKEITP